MSNSPTQLEQLLQALEEIQALDVIVIPVSQQTSVTDYMVICSGRSSRHVKAIAQTVIETMKPKGLSCLGSHGLDLGEWVLADFGDYVLHVMQADIRLFYNLEGLWQASSPEQ